MALPGVPTNTSISSITQTSAQFSWSSPPSVVPPIQGYLVSWTSTPGNGSSNLITGTSYYTI